MASKKAAFEREYRKVVTVMPESTRNKRYNRENGRSGPMRYVPKRGKFGGRRHEVIVAAILMGRKV